MAQKAKKDRAKSNTAALNTLHSVSIALNTVFVFFSLFFKSRSLVIYFLLSLPSFICQFILETSGRPKYVTAPGSATKTLKSSGEDLAAPGLTEYMFDVIWITWASLVMVLLFGNWGWALFAIVPIFGAYKGYGLLGMARGLMGGAQGGMKGMENEMQQAAANRKQRRHA